MTLKEASRKLQKLDAEIEALRNERGAGENDARTLQDLQSRRQAAAIVYWQETAARTREKLDDLKSDSPTSSWRLRIWWDVLTVLWILGGAGWLMSGLPGAAAGTAATAVAAWFIVRSREPARLAAIRQGEDLLRSTENELWLARQQTAVKPTGMTHEHDQNGDQEAG